MTSLEAPAGSRRRHLVGGGHVSSLSGLLDAAAAAPDGEALGPVVALVVDYASVSLGSVTGRVSGLVSWSHGGAAVVLGLDRSGRPALEVHAGEGPTRADTATADHPVQLGAWHRLAVVVGGESIDLYVDGVLAGSVRCPEVTFPPVGAVHVGRRHDSALLDGDIVLEGATGLIGTVTLAAHSDRESASAAVRADAAPDRTAVDVVTELARWRREDPYRPIFHFLPPAHWMNEPHAPIEADGLHHLFFQSNRTGAHWGGIEWGHAVSTDLVRWQHLPPALSPVDSVVAPDGIWSGGSVLDDAGRPLLFLTAGDSRCTPDQSVAVARPRGRGANTTWVVDPGPLLRMPSRDDLVPGQFRDPFVWREGTDWFMLVGAGIVGRGGTALLFVSADGESWTELGPLHVGDAARHPEVGQMWELPVLLPISSASGRRAHVLFVCPWWSDVPEGRVVEVLHWVGRWDAEVGTFTPWHPEPRRFDAGRHFTGPGGTVLSEGRTILWSIAQDGRTTCEHAEVGWAHNAGLPLELALGDDDTLRIAPVRELAGLREGRLVDVAGAGPVDARVGAVSVVAADIPVSPLELDVRCDSTSGVIRVDIVYGPSNELHASIRFDCATGVFDAVRPDAPAYDSWSPTTRDSAVLDPPGGPVRLRVFLDGSMLEAYLDDTNALTTRVRPPLGARVRVTLPAGAHGWTVRGWRLGAADATPLPSEPTA